MRDISRIARLDLILMLILAIHRPVRGTNSLLLEAVGQALLSTSSVSKGVVIGWEACKYCRLVGTLRYVR